MKISILDNDEKYIKGLVSYINNKYNNQVELSVFSNFDSLKNNFNNADTDILVATLEFKDDIESLNVRKPILFLTSNVNDVEENIIYKYQGMNSLYKEMIGAYSIVGKDRRSVSKEIVVSVFSGASGGVGNTTVAIAAAYNLAKNGKKTIYVNLEEDGYIDHIIKNNTNKTMRDVLYAIKRNDVSSLSLKIESLIQEDSSGVCFIYPFTNILDYKELNKDDITLLLETLKTIKDVKAIIIDVDSNDSLVKDALFELADNIFLVSDTTTVSNAKLIKRIELLKQLDIRNDNNILSKVQIIYNKVGNKSLEANVDDVSVFDKVNKYTFSDSTNAGSLLIKEIVNHNDFVELGALDE